MKWLVITISVVLLFAGVSAKGKRVSLQQRESAHRSKQCSHEVESAEKTVPSIVSFATKLNVLELESPTLMNAEAVIEKNAREYSKVISAIERYYAHTSEITNLEKFEEVTKKHSRLAKAVSELLYVEEDDSSFSLLQQGLQSAMFTDSEVLTALSDYTHEKYPSLHSASQKILKAEVAVPSVVELFAHAASAMKDSSTLAIALHGLSTKVFTLPKSVDAELLEVISDSPDLASAVRASLASCYPTAFTDATEIGSYERAHETVQSAISGYLKAAESEKSIGSAVASVIKEQQPSAYDALDLLNTIYNSWSSAPTALSFEQMLADASPSLDSAAHVLQSYFFNSPSTAKELAEAIVKPSKATSSELKQESQHPTLVSAIKYETQWISDHSQYSSTLARYESHIFSELEAHSTLVDALSTISRLNSPKVDEASHSIGEARELVKSITTDMDTFEDVAKYSPSITCAESAIALYDVTEPYTVEHIWEGLTNPADITSEKSFQATTDRYPKLMAALNTILDAVKNHSSLQSVQSALNVVEESDSRFTQQWVTYTEAADSIDAIVAAKNS